MILERFILVHRLWGVYLGEGYWTLENDPGMPGAVSFGTRGQAQNKADYYIRQGLTAAGFSIVGMLVEFPFVGPETLMRNGIDKKMLGNMRQNKLDCLRGH